MLHCTALPQVTHLRGAGGARRHPQEENTRGSPQREEGTLQATDVRTHAA